MQIRIWATEVILKQVNFKGDDYTAKYEVTLWDHFGLNYSDLERFFYYGNGFRAWLILQHIKGFKPFITKITFAQEFKGNLNKSKAIVNPEREKRKKEIERKEKLRNIGRKKQGEY